MSKLDLPTNGDMFLQTCKNHTRIIVCSLDYFIERTIFDYLYKVATS